LQLRYLPYSRVSKLSNGHWRRESVKVKSNLIATNVMSPNQETRTHRKELARGGGRSKHETMTITIITHPGFISSLRFHFTCYALLATEVENCESCPMFFPEPIHVLIPWGIVHWRNLSGAVYLGRQIPCRWEGKLHHPRDR